MLRQDCCLILPPYPFSLEDPSDMPLEDAWHVRPQLFFKCILLSQNGTSGGSLRANRANNPLGSSRFDAFG